MTDIVEELHLGANILLAYFHYCCKGCRPFDLGWDAAQTTSMAELDHEQINFVQRTAGYVHSNGITPLPYFSDRLLTALKVSKFRDVKEKCVYEDEHYYIAQLYDQDWAPSTIVM